MPKSKNGENLKEYECIETKYIIKKVFYDEQMEDFPPHHNAKIVQKASYVASVVVLVNRQVKNKLLEVFIMDVAEYTYQHYYAISISQILVFGHLVVNEHIVDLCACRYEDCINMLT